VLDARYLRENFEEASARLVNRGKGVSERLAQFKSLEDQRIVLMQEVQDLQTERNSISKEIGVLKRNQQDASELLERMQFVSADYKDKEIRLRELEEQAKEALLWIPNFPDEATPIGQSEEDSVEVRQWGEPIQLPFEPKPHWELAEQLGIIDWERGSRLSGSRFWLMRGQGARLERCLYNFMLDLHTQKHGYHEIYPPYLALRESMIVSAQIPNLEEDMFSTQDDLYLIPTAEVALTSLHRGELLEASDLPKRYCAFSACFRREAGAAGKDSRGLIRRHQFNKVELYKFTTPETSDEELAKLVSDAEAVLQALELPYRVLDICTGDLGFQASRKLDLEAWLCGQNKFVEISSCSNCTDYQARRGEIRYRPEPGGKPRFVHTLNGSGLAVGRAFAAILENNQTEDGRVRLPEALRPYFGAEYIVPEG